MESIREICLQRFTVLVLLLSQPSHFLFLLLLIFEGLR